jgi:transcriptional regulator of acetoin/glycerol metabolism
MNILVEYPWPNNYVQFERILSQLIITAKDNVIREADVRNGLSLEKVESHINTIVSPSIPLKGTLADIEKEIISQALKDNNGNQSITAKQLGISRTTLWRILQNN